MSDGAAASGSADIEASLHDLYENAPCGYFSTTLDGVIVRVNETFVRMSGHSRERLLGAQVLSILTGGGQLFYESRYLPVLHLQGEAREVALTVRHASGDDLPVLVNGDVIDDEQGRPAAIRTAVFPYSERREYEQEMLAARRVAEISETRLRLLHGASRSFSAADDDEQLAAELAGSVREAFAAPDVLVYLLDDAGDPVLAAGTPVYEVPLPSDEGPLKRSLQTQEVVVFDTADAIGSLPPAAAESLRIGRVATVAIVPLADQQKPLGAFVMFFRRERRLEAHDVELAEILARQAAEVLSRLRAERVLERMALHDELTGLPRRRVVRARVNEAIDEAVAAQHPMAIVTVAVDGLAGLADTFGNTAVEDALLEIGARLTDTAREGDLVGRIGSDEFAIVSSGLEIGAIEATVDGLLASLRRPLRADSGDGGVSVTIGAAVYSGAPGARPSAQSLFECADAARYRAKGAGQNEAIIATVG